MNKCPLSARLDDREDASGATMIEYALMALLIAAACVAAVGVVGVNTNANFSKVGSSLN